jgi:hypothetical protein
MQPNFIDVNASASYLGPGAIEVDKYQAEIVDMVRRRFPFGQRIAQVPATGQPSRYFEQLGIPTAAFGNPRVLTATATQSTRVERVVTLKALLAQINFSIFDVEVNQQQGQFSFLEAKDLTDTVDGTLKLHDQALWNGTDTSLIAPTTTQYFGVSGQIVSAAAVGGGMTPVQVLSSTGSLVDQFKHQVSMMAARQDFEVRPDAFYSNPLFLDLFDREAKQFQLYFNKVQILPGVIVQGIPTQVGIIPLIGDPAITVPNYNPVSTNQYTGFFITEKLIEYHWLTNPLPRVFQLGLLGNLAAQYVIAKFGAVVCKASGYAHSALVTTR